MRNGGPPPKRPAPSGPMGRRKQFSLSLFSVLYFSFNLTLFLFVCFAAPMSRDRDLYGPPPPRRDSLMSRRDDYPSPRDDHYSVKDR